MLYMVNTTIWSWDMDDYRKHGQKTFSLWNVVLSENAENIVDGEGFKRRSFRKSQNQEKIIQHHTKKKNYNILGTSSARMETHCIAQFWMERWTAREDAEDLEWSGQQTSLNGQDWSTTKQSDRHNTAKNGGPLHPTLGKRTEHDDDDDHN